MIPIVSIVGRKNSGKTTLIESLVPELRKRGYAIGVIKHHSHIIKQGEVDCEGKDTYRYQLAGAQTTVLAGQNKLMLIRKLKNPCSIDEISRMYLSELDLILTEGYKLEDKPKIEVFRQEIVKKTGLLCNPEKDNLVAVVSDCPFNLEIPCFELSDYSKIADFLEEEFIRR
ncbi:MAG: molybdopterin-guanine dinucleotide biosynthesis protein B [bacterium]